MSAAQEYIDRQPPLHRAALEELRAAILAAEPDCQEAIRRRVPAYLLDGRQLVSMGAAQHHVSLYVMYGRVLEHLADRLAPFDVSRTVVRFPPDEPVPADLVTEIVRLRAAELRSVEPPPASVESSPIPSTGPRTTGRVDPTRRRRTPPEP